MSRMIDSYREERKRVELPKVSGFTCNRCFIEYRTLDDFANHECEG